MAGRPDFFIAGAAKCGTTALFDYLSRHPAVFVPTCKEPKFFCTDLKTTGGVYGADQYRDLFTAAPEGSTSGEASTLYLYSKVAIERIMNHNHDARIIVMLRNPADAAHSLHAAAWNHGHENIGDFELAWRVQKERLRGRNMPERWPDPATLQYGAIYRYASQVRRVMERVPAQQRCFLIYEDFFADPVRHYAAVLGFLRLAPDESTSFEVINPAIGPRSRRLENILRKPPRWLKALYTPLRPLFRATGVHPATALRELNSVPRDKAPLRAEFAAELDRYFAADIAELEMLLGRPLWRGVRLNSS